MRRGKTTGTSRQQSHYLKSFGLHAYGGLQENLVSMKPLKGYIYTVPLRSATLRSVRSPANILKWIWNNSNIIMSIETRKTSLPFKFLHGCPRPCSFHFVLTIFSWPVLPSVLAAIACVAFCNQIYLNLFYMDQWWSCCISSGEWAEGSRAWPASPCKDQRICWCSSSKPQ